MTPTVRPATPDDAEVVCLFNRLLARESEGKELDADLLRRGVAAGLADPARGRYFLAELEGTVVGQLAITFEWSDWRCGWFWWLQSVYVRPEDRRRGVFRSLLEHVLTEAGRDPEVCGVRLYVERDNTAAHAVYQRHGLAWTNYRVMEQYPL